jgi:NAD(P)-dependent dehydrogenase (short-subunit alcohol dehydrogenase family)
MDADLAATAGFDGKYAVITGGTQGLGEATAELLGARGAAGLVICGRNRERGAAVAGRVTANGCPTHFVEADLARVEDARAVIAAADGLFGNLHVLVNCAGVSDRGGILDTEPEDFDRIFAVNVRGPFFLIQEAAKVMIREGSGGAIVSILSMASYGGRPNLSPYAASKAALGALTKNAALALMPYRIRVNALNIGQTNTPGLDQVRREQDGAAQGWLEEVNRKQPFGRLHDSADIARAIAFMASAESAHSTGAIVDFAQHVMGAFGGTPQADPHGPG